MSQCKETLRMQCELEEGHEGSHSNPLDGKWRTGAGGMQPGSVRISYYPEDNPDSVVLYIPISTERVSILRLSSADAVDKIITALLEARTKAFGEAH